MATYAVVNSNNIVENILEIDEKSPYLNILTTDLEKDSSQLIKVSKKTFYCNMGDVWNGEKFTPPKPYPSWMWDKNKYVWRPPVIHPNLWDNILPESNTDYKWNEEEQRWDQL